MKQPYFLVIEDDEDQAVLFKKALERINPERPVVFRPDAASALEYLEGCLGYDRRLLAALPALVVLDLRLPDAEAGLDFLRRVRAAQRDAPGRRDAIGSAQTELARQPSSQTLCHGAETGQLPPGDREDRAFALDALLTRARGGCLVVGGEQRPEPGPRREDVRLAELGARHEPIRRVEQVANLGGAGERRPIGRRVEVGRADHGRARPRDQEHHTTVDAR